MQSAGELFRGLAGGDTEGTIAGQIDEGGGHLAPVAEFESALTETAPGDDPDRVGSAAVDLDEGDQALAVAATGLVDAETPAAEHSHTDAENLPGAEVTVRGFGHGQQIVEGFHRIP